MSYKIIGDSCCDYTEQMGGIPWLARVPIGIELDGVQYLDDGSIDVPALLEHMDRAAAAPRTFCPAPGRYMQEFEGEAEDIYIVTLSDKLSGSYNSALTAKQTYAELGGKKNIHVFNSLSAAAGEDAAVLYIHDLCRQGLPFAEVCRLGDKFCREMHTFFIVENLDVFKKNGRLNHLEALLVDALRLKMIMGGDREGRICVLGKALSMSSAIKKMVAMIAVAVEKSGKQGRRVVMMGCECPERLEMVRDMIMEKCPFCEAVLYHASGATATYANRGGFNVCF